MRVAFMPDPERAAEISASEKVVAGLVSVIIPQMLLARVLFSIGQRGNTLFTKGRRLIDVQYALKFKIMADDGQMKEAGEMEMGNAPRAAAENCDFEIWGESASSFLRGRT